MFAHSVSGNSLNLFWMPSLIQLMALVINSLLFEPKDREVYGKPLAKAIKLVKVLCQTSRRRVTEAKDLAILDRLRKGTIEPVQSK